MAYRNWNIHGYTSVADYAVEKYNMQVILTGGPSGIEKQYGQAISQNVKHPVTNLVAKTSLKQLVAILQQAAAVIAPMLRVSWPDGSTEQFEAPVIDAYTTIVKGKGKKPSQRE